MIEMNFVMGGELLVINIEEGIIRLKGKMSNYGWMDLRDLTKKEKKKLNKKYGDEWFESYLDALKLKENMDDKEIAEDLKKDLQKSGWRLYRNELS